MAIRARVLIFLGLWLLTSGVFAAPDLRVEPPNWWVGMVSPNLQLMVHGEEIGQSTQVLVNSDDVRVAEVHRAESDNYLFVDLELQAKAAPQTVELQFQKNGKLLASYSYELKERAQGSPSRQGFSPADVIYLITPDRFANGDSGNDQIDGLSEGLNRSEPGGRHGGDIAGVIERLDYFESMGFTQLWLNPVLENAQPDYSYHGYATTDFYAVDARMGSNQLYRELSLDAQTRGIGLIKDVILNHCGSGHWWMDDLPFADWINFSGTFSPTSHRRETLRDPHVAAVDQKAFSDGWFVPTMPDLNQRNPFMAEYLIQNTVWWIEFAGLSGVRVDTYSYPDKTFLNKWSQRVMLEYSNFNIVGEEWSENPAVVAYWQAGKNNADGYRSFTPSMMDFPWQKAMVEALNNPEAWGSGLVQLYEALSNDFLYPDPYQLVIFPDNHDMSRIYTELDEQDAHWQMAMVLTLTMRGIPQMYYGTEILMTNPGTDDHGVIRTDFPGGWQGDDVNAFTGAGLSEKAKGAQRFLRQLLQWRKGNEAIHHGKLMHYVPRDGVYVYFRYLDRSAVMVVINHSDEVRSLEPAIFSERTAGFEAAKNVLTGVSVTFSEALSPMGKSVAVYELQPE